MMIACSTAQMNRGEAKSKGLSQLQPLKETLLRSSYEKLIIRKRKSWAVAFNNYSYLKGKK